MVTFKGGIFSNAQAITASAATTACTDVVDTEVAASNIGGGTPIWLVCRVNTAFADAASATLIVDLEECATSGGTYTDLLKSKTYTVGQLVKGLDLLTVPLPVDNLRYLRTLYNYAVGSGFTAGNIDAFLTLGPPLN